MHFLRKLAVVGVAPLALLAVAVGPTAAQQNSINGRVTGAGAPITGSTVTL